MDGAPTTNFCRRVLDARLATRQVYVGQTHVYHVTSPGLYDAVDEPNSRLRRPAEPASVTRRLMTLDVLIAHRHQRCLATEREPSLLQVPPHQSIRHFATATPATLDKLL